MIHDFYIVAAVVSVLCLAVLLASTLEKENFFVTRILAEWLFPGIEPYQRQRKLEYFAGIILALVVVALAVVLIINRSYYHH